jgi:hypothetical protein
VVLGEAPDVSRAAFSQLTDDERVDARPVAIVFERVPEQPSPPVELGLTGSLLADMVLDIQARGPVLWRLAPRAAVATNGNGHRSNGSVALNGGSGNGNGNGHDSADDRLEAALNGHGRSASQTHALSILKLDPVPGRDRAEAWVQRAVSWQAPRLPGLTAGAVRRWETAATWIPPETGALSRHRVGDEEQWAVTVDRHPPRGYRLEFDLGVVHRFALPGTRRLVQDGETFVLTDEESELTDGRHALGYVEQAPLPMLDVLELRRMPGSGKHVLVAGPADPLFNIAEPIATLGWIESFPIQPRWTKLHLGPWGAVALRRYVDGDAWRHRYRVGAPEDEPEGVSLGSLLRGPGDAVVALRLRSDGRVETELASPSRASLDPRAAARWVVAPLSWNRGVPPAWAQRATGTRARRLLRSQTGRVAHVGRQRQETLGWLRRKPATGYSPLFSATHPVSGDQFLTRSELEATELGYRVDGVLGYIFNAGADHASILESTTVLWGARFGKGRRYAERDW